MAAQIAQEVWEGETVEVIVPGHAFTGFRGTVVEAFRHHLVVDIPVGFQDNRLNFKPQELAVL